MQTASGKAGHGLVGISMLVLAAFAATGTIARGASAGDAAAQPAATAYTLLETQIKNHIRDKSLDALKKDVEQVTKAMADAEDAKSRTRLGTLLSLIVNGTTEDGVQRAAIVAIGASKEATLFGSIRRFLSQPDLDVEPPLCKVAIEAAGKLLVDDAVLPLMTLVDKSHVLSLSSAAMEAFALYGTKKNIRGKILRDLVGTVEKDRPGVGQRWDSTKGDPVATAKTRTNEMSRQRWDALSGVLVTTLNKMTGTQAATAEDWFKLYDDYKGGLDKLFVDPAK